MLSKIEILPINKNLPSCALGSIAIGDGFFLRALTVEEARNKLKRARIAKSRAIKKHPTFDFFISVAEYGVKIVRIR